MASIQTSVTDFFRKKDKKKRKAADEDTEGPRKISSDPPRDGEIDNKKHKSNEPTPAAAPKPVFSIFGGAKPPPKQAFKAPPYRSFEDWQREGLAAEYTQNKRLDARRKKALALTYKVEEKQVENYWAKIRGVDPSYVKKPPKWTKPEVAPGVPGFGDLPVDALMAIKGAYDEDTSLFAERQKTLAEENKIQPLQVQYYWEKLRDLDPKYERQTRHSHDGNGQERKLAKREAQRAARLSAKH